MLRYINGFCINLNGQDNLYVIVINNTLHQSTAANFKQPQQLHSQQAWKLQGERCGLQPVHHTVVYNTAELSDRIFGDSDSLEKIENSIAPAYVHKQ